MNENNAWLKHLKEIEKEDPKRAFGNIYYHEQVETAPLLRQEPCARDQSKPKGRQRMVSPAQQKAIERQHGGKQ